MAGVSIVANQPNQTYTGTSDDDTFTVESYGDTLNGGGGGIDTFIVNTTSAWYNTYSANAGSVIEAGADDVFIGLSNFGPTSGVSTINVEGKTGVTIGGSGGQFDLSGVQIVGGSATILANQPSQAVTGTAGGDTFVVSAYNDALNGGGGIDTFVVDTKSAWYNAYSASAGSVIEAGADDVFIGLSNFGPASGVSTINVEGKTGVTIGGSGGQFDLSGVQIVGGSATILADQPSQVVTGTAGGDTFAVSVYNDTLNGGGGIDTFVVDTKSAWYNAYSASAGSVIEAGADDVFIGLSNFGPTSGVSAINVEGKTGVTIGGSGSHFDLSGVQIVGGSATIQANQPSQAVTGTAGGDTFAGSSLFQVGELARMSPAMR